MLSIMWRHYYTLEIGYITVKGKLDIQLNWLLIFSSLGKLFVVSLISFFIGRLNLLNFQRVLIKILKLNKKTRSMILKLILVDLLLKNMHFQMLILSMSCELIILGYLLLFSTVILVRDGVCV